MIFEEYSKRIFRTNNVNFTCEKLNTLQIPVGLSAVSDHILSTSKQIITEQFFFNIEKINV